MHQMAPSPSNATRVATLVACFAAILLLAAGCGSSPPGGGETDTGASDADSGSGDTDTGNDADDTDPDAECPPGDDGCPCPEGGECGEDLLCNADTNVCEPCEFGEDGCRCVPSVDPSEDPTCDEGLTCTEDDLCECVAGTEDCPCGAGDACDDGLECVVGICSTPGCIPGTTGCPCDAGSCDDDTAYCTDGGVCEECAANAPGCACTTTCTDGLVCDASFCRDAVTCDDADCAERQLCDEGAGRDAVCLDDCELGYIWDSVGRVCNPAPNCDACTDDNRECSLSTGAPVCGTCVEGYLEDPTTEACVDVVTCEELECDGFCREATVEGTAVVDAECNDNPCETGYLLSAGGACSQCTQCFDFVGADATPKTGVIGNETTAFDGGGVTSACVCQFDPAAAGRFQNVEGGVITLCDADSDGWVNVRFLDVLNLAIDRTRNRFFQNATCDLRSVDRFELVSDDDRDAVGTVSVDDVVDAYGIAGSQFLTDHFGTPYVYLVEPQETDVPALMARRYTTSGIGSLSNYPGGAFLASEVNPLSRACNFTLGVNDDVNLDGAIDVVQAHDVSFAGGATRPAAVFYHMSYYIELSRSYYREIEGSPGGHGAYVIVEKARSLTAPVAEQLELTYVSSTGPYWRECLRSRDASYESGVTLPASTTPADAPLNYDYARWHECEVSIPGDGDCQVSDVDAENPRRGRGPYIAYDGRRPITAAARYDEAGDGVWPGMNHHSQFKCLALGNGTSVVANPQGHVALADVSSGDVQREWTMVECRLAPTGTTLRTVGSDGPLVGDANPADPQFACQPVTNAAQISAFADSSTENGRRYWFVANYRHYAPGEPETEYSLGCINEAMEWPFLCNGYDPNPFFSTAVPSGTIGNYGRLVCGCSVNTGGPECDVGCPTNNVHYGGTFSDDPSGSFACTNGYCLTHSAVPEDGFAGGRRGFWMCGDFSATAFTDPTLAPDYRSPDYVEDEDGAVTGWRIEGEIPTTPFHRVRLTQPDVAEGSGWSVY